VRVHFSVEAWSEINGWAGSDPKLHAKVVELINDVRRSPFRGLGKPEPMSGDWKASGHVGLRRSTV
jgi:toxin YoeB